jgi:cell division protein FtsI (penicillin-binding protein 3)
MLTAAEVFKHSSNIGTYKIARRIGREALREALVRFGFGRPTGVGLPGERAGTLHPTSRWGEIGFATHAFGQGLTVTPLQLAAGFSAIASGGVYRPPRLALRVRKPDGRVEALPPPATERRVMSAAAARTLLEIMRGVTDGTAKQAAIDGYPVAGKTGTAQKVTDGKYGDKRVSSFVGIVPADDPRLVIAIVVDEPNVKVAYGGLIAAPAFREIAEQALRYLGVRPTAPLAASAAAPNAAARKPPTKVAEEAAQEGPGSDLAPAELEALARAEALAGEEAEASGELVTVPDFSGMSMGEAIRAARRAGIDLVPEGSGLAVQQSLGPGRTARGSVCRVAFRPGG